MEEESWGLLTKNKFDHLLNQFTKRFGEPIHPKRLSFSFWDHSRNNIDTRIRIFYCQGPNRVSETFEIPLARMELTIDGSYNLS